MAQPTPEETNTLLTRLSQKPGVQSTLILSRSTGAIVRASGLLSTNVDNTSDGTMPASPTTTRNSRGSFSHANGGTRHGLDSERQEGGLRSAEDVSRLVWGFFSSAGSMVEEMMGKEDGVRLLRLRTKRNELVIVPGRWQSTSLERWELTESADQKFLLVVIHDTPPA
ncbi:MAG: hypothetical protein M1828_004531 [Chrysothrix sp. TS-e1954]|nr:MAG: hypothetical protein M1828_004531 [Chrysothrix sp. TS-e1954]